MNATEARALRHRKVIEAHKAQHLVRQRCDEAIRKASMEERDYILFNVPRQILLPGGGALVDGYDVREAAYQLLRSLEERGFKVGFPGSSDGSDGRIWIGWHGPPPTAAPAPAATSSSSGTSSSRRTTTGGKNDTGTSLSVLQKLMALNKQIKENERHGVHNEFSGGWLRTRVSVEHAHQATGCDDRKREGDHHLEEALALPPGRILRVVARQLEETIKPRLSLRNGHESRSE